MIRYDDQREFMLKEQRRNPRIKTSNKIDYNLFTSLGEKLYHGQGQTINLSQSGALLKTDIALKGVFIKFKTTDIGGEDVYAKGRIIYSLKHKPSSKFLSGIKFIGTKEKNLEVITSFVKAYHHGIRFDEKRSTTLVEASE
jgi:hypothetical protein